MMALLPSFHESSPLPAWRILAALVAGVVVAPALVAVIVAVRRPVPVTARTLRIAVTDGPGHDQHVSLDATFFIPPGRGRVPAILPDYEVADVEQLVTWLARQPRSAGRAGDPQVGITLAQFSRPSLDSRPPEISDWAKWIRPN